MHEQDAKAAIDDLDFLGEGNHAAAKETGYEGWSDTCGNTGDVCALSFLHAFMTFMSVCHPSGEF